MKSDKRMRRRKGKLRESLDLGATEQNVLYEKIFVLQNPAHTFQNKPSHLH